MGQKMASFYEMIHIISSMKFDLFRWALLSSSSMDKNFCGGFLVSIIKLNRILYGRRKGALSFGPAGILFTIKIISHKFNHSDKFPSMQIDNSLTPSLKIFSQCYKISSTHLLYTVHTDISQFLANVDMHQYLNSLTSPSPSPHTTQEGMHK